VIHALCNLNTSAASSLSPTSIAISLIEDIIPFIGIGKRVNQKVYAEQNKERIKKQFLEREQSAVDKARQKELDKVKFENGQVVKPEDEEQQ